MWRQGKPWAELLNALAGVLGVRHGRYMPLPIDPIKSSMVSGHFTPYFEPTEMSDLLEAYSHVGDVRKALASAHPEAESAVETPSVLSSRPPTPDYAFQSPALNPSWPINAAIVQRAKSAYRLA